MRLGLSALSVLVLAAASAAGQWPHWRGPTADGISPETDLPTEWGPQTNIFWKAPLEGVGTSTPIVWDGQVILTMQAGRNPLASLGRQEGPAAREAPNSGQGVQFVVRSYALSDGRLNWEHRFAAEGGLPSTHGKHNLASPSCVTDGKMIYAWMGTGQLVALDMEGKTVWQRHIGREYAPFEIRWGHGSSPALYKERLFLLCDHQQDAYLLALNKRTGREIWKVDRGGARSYTTPFILPGEKPQLVINSSERIDVYDAESGKLLWHVGQPNRVPVGTPVFHDGVLYSSRGYRSGPYMAVKASANGNASQDRILWRVPTGAPYISSLLYHDGLVYLATESGVASCIDAATGETLWKKRLGGYFSASPVVADGKIFMVNEEGQTFVLEAGRKFKQLSRNDLGERTLASPAIADGRILLRTDEHLVCIRKPD